MVSGFCYCYDSIAYFDSKSDYADNADCSFRTVRS